MLRYSGLSSRSSVSRVLCELEDMGVLVREIGAVNSPVRPTNNYVLRPDSDDLRAQANLCAQQHKDLIAAERELRQIRKKS